MKRPRKIKSILDLCFNTTNQEPNIYLPLIDFKCCNNKQRCKMAFKKVEQNQIVKIMCLLDKEKKEFNAGRSRKALALVEKSLVLLGYKISLTKIKK